LIGMILNLLSQTLWGMGFISNVCTKHYSLNTFSKDKLMKFKIQRGTQEISGSCVEIWTK
jgi:hypothetical protein